MGDAPHHRFNACYNALDLRIVRGAADDPAVVRERVEGASRTMTYAELLAEVAAFAGALHAVGVKQGDAVAIPAGLSVETVIAILACARIGAVQAAPDDSPVSAELRAPSEGAPLLFVGAEEIDWDVAMRAGRTDPAAVVAVPATAPDTAPRPANARLVFSSLLAGEPITLGAR